MLSGIQPTGGLHLGNYLGALRNWVREQERFENFFCIVDLHAITEPQVPDVLRSKTLDLGALFLASGLDPSRCEIFLQSHVPAHSELAWIMECLTPMGWLERMTQFRARSQAQGRERVGTGVFTYPALMAADILLYDADFVPVGDDQRQHIEYTRDLAQRINSLYGDGVVRVPEPLIRETGARVMGLDDPTVKMSKSTSTSHAGHAVFLLDPPDVIRRKISRAQTDAKPAVEPPVGPGVANLIDIYAALRELSHETAMQHFEGKSYSVLKGETADAIITTLEPIQSRYEELRADEAALHRVLDQSAEHARVVAAQTLRRVQRAVGLR